MLFIDANIYLEFFKSSNGSFKTLLPGLESLKDEIFITEQIVNEVLRNKLKVASDSLKEYLNKYKSAYITLPEHLDNTNDEKIKTWNQKNKETINSLNDSLFKIIDELLDKIKAGEDSTSITLDKLFKISTAPSKEEIERAKLRRELGNPPGKYENPLGDQLSWEQLLSKYDTKSPLWIISRDSDYYSELKDKQYYLNAFLFSETKKKSANNLVPKVYIFKSLAEGLKHYRSTEKPIENLPSDEELSVIAKEEELRQPIFLPKSYADPYKKTIICIKCGKESFSTAAAKPSQFGGWTYQYPCYHCGHLNDFGEPYDD